MTAALLASHTGTHRKPSLPRRVLSRLTDSRERDDTRAGAGLQQATERDRPEGPTPVVGERGEGSRAVPRAAGTASPRGAQPPAPGLLRRCHIAALWLLAVLGDWWLNWRTWRAERRRAEDIEIARHDAQMARVEDHEPGPAVAAACAVTALIEAATDAVGIPPVRVGEPGPVATGPLPAAMADVDGDRPWEYPTGQFTALIDQMTPPARRADTF